jgi:hypothetical protein
MTTVEELFEQFKQLPDWDRFPMPEVFYEHFKVKKPQPSVSLMEVLNYTPPPYKSLLTNGKIEIRKPAEGGVREIKELMVLPVEQTLIPDENESCMLTDSEQTTLNPPTECSTIENQHESDHQSSNPSDAYPYISYVAPYLDAEYNPEQKNPQNELS